MSIRRQSREIALQILFQREFIPHLSVAQSLDLFRSHFSAPVEVWSYAESLVTGISRYQSAIDIKLSDLSQHWKVSRMSLVDRNILRAGVFELEYGEPPLPPAVVINEAVEIAKKYGSSDSAGFINGVLDQFKPSER